MNILAIDTATSVISVALAAGNETWFLSADAGLRQSEILMELIDTLLLKAGIKASALEAVSCMQGPGSFTGLRIGFAAAKGLSLSLNIPFMPVPTLDCMAWHLSCWPGIVIPAIDARKHAFYTALYQKGKPISDYMDADTAFIAKSLMLLTPKQVKKSLSLQDRTPKCYIRSSLLFFQVKSFQFPLILCTVLDGDLLCWKFHKKEV
jgi:tRNA threonylcarbamoyladenosine biosynthesis protein TsaB